MRGVPECLSRRYQALDDLIKELSLNLSTQSSRADCSPCKDPSIKLMCQFWNILKEDPEYNLPDAVQQRLCEGGSGHCYYPQRLTCYMAEEEKAKEDEEANCCKPEECAAAASATSEPGHDKVPLAKILCNLKDAASYDKQCSARLNELMQTEKKLQAQIQVLEKREKNGAQLLKQADCMWSCMEEAYKKKVAESLERQKELLGELKDVEKSAAKWRKHKKELESQLSHIAKCQEEINEKINQKTNDMSCMDREMEDFKKRIDINKKDSEKTKKSLTKRRADSDARMQNINEKVKKLQADLAKEKNIKKEKETEGNQYIKEARDDLQKICKLLLQKKLENEDLSAEKAALLLEIEILKQTSNQCKDKCKNKRESIEADIKKIQQDIEGFEIRCIRCHECTDTDDVRKFCTDCPKCMEERECIFSGDHCDPDHTMDCVCQDVKQKFLDNVFDNMYTVLERQAKSGTGKAVAEAVLDCLKRSTNGKLNEETRKILQEFILTTVKRNLNLTIVGGAVKTRCEMDNETYKQLMTCLQKIKATPRPKEDKGTDSKKESCRRWGGTSECNCPKGPKACICTKKAPPPPDDPAPCPPQDKEDAGEVVKCPNKKNTSCGPDCGAHTVPSMVGTEPARWLPNPCEPPTCTFKKNMRAAQCVLGPESLSSSQSYKTAFPHIQSMAVLQDQITCKCGAKPIRPCACKKDCKSQPRQRMIEEVIGRYLEVTPISKITTMDETESPESKMPGRNDDESCVCRINHPQTSNTSKNKPSRCTFLSNGTLFKDGSYLQEKFVDKSVNFCGKQKISKRSSKKYQSLLDDKTPMKNKTGMIKMSHIQNTNETLDGKSGNKHQNIPAIDRLKSASSLKLPLKDFLFSNNIDHEHDNTNSGIALLGKEVNDTVKALVKDIVVHDITSKYNIFDGNVELITIESLLQEIVSLTQTPSQRKSDETINEIEITNESCERNKEEKLQKEMILGENDKNVTFSINDSIIEQSSSQLHIGNESIFDSQFLKTQINSNEEYKNVERRISDLYAAYESLKTMKKSIDMNISIRDESLENIQKTINDAHGNPKNIKEMQGFKTHDHEIPIKFCENENKETDRKSKIMINGNENIETEVKEEHNKYTTKEDSNKKEYNVMTARIQQMKERYINQGSSKERSCDESKDTYFLSTNYRKFIINNGICSPYRIECRKDSFDNEVKEQYIPYPKKENLISVANIIISDDYPTKEDETGYFRKGDDEKVDVSSKQHRR